MRHRILHGRAFTLIELLVVVSIIALLISIMLPALGRARMLAQRTQCSSNVRQLVIAAITAANDNNGIWPARHVNLRNQTHGFVARRQASEDSRGLWEMYVSGYTIEDSAEGFYCPSMPEGEHIGLRREDAWPAYAHPAGWYNWGYYYLPHQPDDWRWQGTLDPPKNLEDHSRVTIWTDVTIGEIGSAWRSVPHAAIGAGFVNWNGQPESQRTAPEGTHTARVDGSVQFDAYAIGVPVDDQPMLEYSVKHGANPGNLQGRPFAN